MPTISEAFAIALAHHQAGRFDLAEDIYRRILAVEPNHVDATHLLGAIAHQTGRQEEAVELIRRAIAANPAAAGYHNNLGEAYRALDMTVEAIDCYRRAIELQPDYAEAHNNLGLALRGQKQLAESIACHRRALELKPNNAGAYSNLGVAFKEMGKLDEAIACYRRAIELNPGLATVHNNLGVALQEQGKLGEAVACYRRALELEPNLAEALANLGAALKDDGQLDEAAACHRRAIELKPDFAMAYGNLGVVFKEAGQLDEAVAYFRRAIELRPDYAEGHSNLLYTLLYCPGYDAQSLYREHRRWSQQHAEPLAGLIQPHLNDRSPERRLRIGYMSPDFRFHPIGRFLLPLLERHDHRAFEIFCYSSALVPDAITQACRAAADMWRDVPGLSDEQLADAVREDRIDVLVDLTMHMAHNRMLVFARKPAPVQVTYLAYCGTTGLDTIDYRLTDPYLDPPGADESCYAERSLRLPATYWCYRPPEPAPEAGRVPALEAGRLTFGCLNNFCKVTAPALAAWGRLLRAVSASKLLLHARAGSHRQRVQALLAEQGVEPEQVEFLDLVPIGEYLRRYQQIDVALDPFPYGGGTTTCDALWMGVPVVSLAGQTGVGRSGLSILSNVGLPELAARDVDQYVRIAAELAGDLPRLAGLRTTLRERMQNSPLMDEPRFARSVESAFRQMWRTWCAG